MVKRYRCPHGLDLRTHPRCFLCEPEQRPWPVATGGNASLKVGSTVYCTCPPNRGDSYAGTCPIHDNATTYTA